MRVTEWIDLTGTTKCMFNSLVRGNLRTEIVGKLYDRFAVRYPSVLLVKLGDNNLYAIKIRPGYENKITNEEFKVVSKDSYTQTDIEMFRMSESRDIMPPGSFIIYELPEYTVNVIGELIRL